MSEKENERKKKEKKINFFVSKFSYLKEYVNIV